MTTILILWFGYVNIAWATSAEFSSPQACEKARQAIIAEWRKDHPREGQFHGGCYSKDD